MSTRTHRLARYADALHVHASPKPTALITALVVML
jgi:hypothetical protein